jgi:[ribosomal protein S18]-alanine N-acetyltransferase
MNLFFKDMSEPYAKEVLMWKYDSPYDFYNNELTTEGLIELTCGTYYAVINENDLLVGFFCLGNHAQVPNGVPLGVYSEKNMIDVGLGMKPELTGKGSGMKFFTTILQYVRCSLDEQRQLRLTVASFNKRAIQLYENIGFEKDKEFISNEITFITMIQME